MEQQIMLVGIKLDELLTKIETIIEAKLSAKESKEQSNASSNKYLSRIEVAKLLKISLPTLHEWTKLNLLKSYKIGNRVLYKLSEVENALSESTISKYKRI